MRNQKGVSLITLVITIIVVIILAAIALGGGATDSIGQADYAGFASEMGDLQDKVSAAIANAKGSERINQGTTRTTEQLANYIARGGSSVVSGEAWLVQSDAALLQATLVNKEFAKEAIGSELPDRKVETYFGQKQEVSYFITNQGTLFCWPPYIYDDKSYIAADIEVKSGDASIAGTDATDPSKCPALTFTLDGGDTTITVTNSMTAATVPNMTRNQLDGTEVTTTISEVVFYDKTADDANALGGVAEGITFNGYDNTAEL